MPTVDAVLTVWMDEWQLACCRTPFSVGSEVTWSLVGSFDRDAMRQWLASPELVAELTDMEEYHYTDENAARRTVTGRVTRIRGVSLRYGPRGGLPVEGSCRVIEVDRAEPGWPPMRGGESLAGWVVTIDEVASVSG